MTPNRDTIAPIRCHHIRAAQRSPAHYLHTRLHGDDGDSPTRAMQRGSGLHELLSGRRQVVLYPGAVRRGEEYEAFVAGLRPDTAQLWRDVQEARTNAAIPGQKGAPAMRDAAEAMVRAAYQPPEVVPPEPLILTATDYDSAASMRDALLSHPVAGPLLIHPDAVYEQTVIRDGVWRSTPDVMLPGVAVEIKSTRNADPDRFLWSARRDYGYDTQAAWHRRVCQVERVVLVVVESAAPHVVMVYEVSGRLMDAADIDIDEALALIETSRTLDEWPGYTADGRYEWDVDEIDVMASAEPDAGETT